MAHKNIQKYNITLQNMTHHINPNLPTSVVFLMIRDKLLIAFSDETGDSVETAATSKEGSMTEGGW